MNSWQFTNMAWLYAAAVLISLLLAYKAMKMRPVRGALTFSLLSLFNSLWSLSHLLGFFNRNLEWKLVLLRFEYLGILGSALLWFIFILAYTDSRKFLRSKVLFVIVLISVIAFFEALFFQTNHVLYKSYGLIQKGEFVRLYKDYGIGFYLIMTYCYLLAVVGTIILLNAVKRMPEQFRAQVLYIAASIFLIIAVNFFYVSGFSPVTDYDFTSVTFALVGMIFYLLISRYKFLDIAPVAHNQIFRKLGSGIIINDARKCIIELNPAAENILGCKQKNVLGKQVTEIFPAYEKITQNAENNNDIKSEIKIEENQRAYSVNITSLKDVSGRPAGNIIMLHDVTELKNALDDLDTYAHTVAHDLKNPLGALIGYSELIDNSTLTDELIEFKDVISENSSKMIQIVESLLLLASVRRQTDLKLERLNTACIIKNSLIRLKNLSDEKNAEIIYPDDCPEVEGNEQWVEEVFVNYISNAIKYGGSPPVVKLSCEMKNDFVKFNITDNGYGLSKEEQENLFKEFNRLAYKNEDAGHGLGLSIVKRIITKLGGQVGVESKIGKGSTFFFTLPRK